MFSYADLDSMVVRGGQGNDFFPLPQRLKGFYEEVFFANILPQDRQLKMPVFHVKTEADIDAEWDDMLKFYAEKLEQDESNQNGYGIHDLFDAPLQFNEVLDMLYEKIFKLGKAHAASKGHGFVYRKPPAWVLLRFLNCALHADQNFSKHLLCLVIMLIVKMDVRSGIAKPLERSNSKTNMLLKVLSEKFSLKFIADRLRETLKTHSSGVMMSHFTWRFKGQCVVDYVNCYFDILGPLRATEEDRSDKLAIDLLILCHRIFQKLSSLTNGRTHNKQDVQLAILCGADIIACFNLLKRHITFNGSSF